METIFDHNPTDKELMRFGGRENLLKFTEKGLYEIEDNRLYHLGLLFSGRKDYEKANSYFDKIEDRSLLKTLVQDF